MNQHKIILPYMSEGMKNFLELKKIIEKKIYNREDISQELKQISNGESEIPKGLRDILHRR